MIFHDLVETADVVVQNYTTACLVDLVLDYETLRVRNPKLIYCSMNGFGCTGPKANDPAYYVVI